MSEIASKPYTEAGSSLAPPFAKKGAATEHDVMFAALFGGVVATQSDAEPLAAELNPAHADADADANPDGNTDILMAMQAVGAMLSGQPAKRQNSDLNAADFEAGGEAGDALTDAHGIASLSDQLDQEQLVNPAMIGPMPLQSQKGKFSDPSQPSGVLGKMAFEDEAPATPSRAAQTAASAPTQHPLPAGKTSLDTAGKTSLDSAGKASLASETTDEMSGDQLDIANSQQGAMRRTPAGPQLGQSHAQQAKAAMLKPTAGPEHVMAKMSGDGDMQFDSPDEFIRALARQTVERSAGRQLADAASDGSTPTNAARLALAAGSAAGGQMPQQNNGQPGGQSFGQSGGFVAASAGMTNGSMMEMLDMAQDNWTEMLLQRVEKGLAGGKDKIDFHLNPRNLGKMRISLMVQNDRTNIHIQTETHAAAQALSEAEARLAQMMDASGVKFGSLTSQYNQNFAGQNNGQNRPE
jgi:flagellar hook-length control protein FliK